MRDQHQLLEETRLALGVILNTPGVFCEGVPPTRGVTVAFGPPAVIVQYGRLFVFGADDDTTEIDPFAQHWTVLVRPNWLAEVYDQGIAVAGGALVLHAERKAASHHGHAEVELWLARVCRRQQSKAGQLEIEDVPLWLASYGGNLALGRGCCEASLEAMRPFREALLGKEGVSS